MALLYVITDEDLSNGLSHSQIAELTCKGGVDILQLRDKTADDFSFLKTAREIRRITEKYGVTFIVNDRVDIAIKSNADGVHVGQSDMKVSEIRKMVSDDFIIGCSVGSVEEAKKAEKDGASHIVLSPVFNTSSKSDAGLGHGLKMLSEIKKNVNVPVYAIGGINKGNAKDVIQAGAEAIAVISAIVSQKDIIEATIELKNTIKA